MTASLGRRRFLASGAASAVGSCLAYAGSADQPSANSSATAVQEPARRVSVVDSADVVVCGAGPAGVVAAVAAARAGAHVRLIESQGQLGGIWTSGLLSWIIDANNKAGILRELTQQLDRRMELLGGRAWDRRGSMPYDVEQMKWVLDQLCQQAKVKVRLHTRVVAAIKDGRRVTHCLTESKSGREAFAGKVFVDCTGDGDLAAQAGCGFDFGRPEAGAGSAGKQRVGEIQPFSLLMLITGIDPQATAKFHERSGAWAAPKDALFAEFRRAGVEPSYGKPTIFRIHDDLYAWMINHEYGYSSLDAQAVTDATLRARAELHQLVDALRRLGDPWKNLKIVATASQIGVREARRVHGRYTVNVDDLLSGTRCPDAVCRVTFGIDVHSTNRAHSSGIEGQAVKGKIQSFDIPLRALVAKDVDGLLLAGRCISGDFLAHSSYRVTGNAAVLGEAAGATAALAAQRNCMPHEVEWPSIARLLGLT